MRTTPALLVVPFALAAALLVAPPPRAAAEDAPAAPAADEPQVTHEVIAAGEGAVCGEGRMAVVHYTGTLTDGKQFDSSRDRGEPFRFVVGAGQVIAGWDRTVARMRVGDRWKVTIPWQLAYGERGAPPDIPPKADLVFDIELLGALEPKVEVIAEGTGPALARGDVVRMHYKLTVVDGETLSDTRAGQGAQPMQVGARTGLMGADMVVARMRVGDHWKVTIQPELAFGSRGAPPKVPANAEILFDVEILEVVQPEIQVITPGEGATPKDGQTVRVHYVGTFADGKQFDSSRDRDEPFEFQLGRGMVIRGWDLALARMKVGERSKVKVPWEIAYGAAGRGSLIPPKSDLYFDIELLEIK